MLDGTTPGSGTGNYSQMQVAGAIGLSGVTLSASLGPDFVPTLGSTVHDPRQHGHHAPISGTFNGQAEGSIVEISGMPFEISYVGGTNSNSVVLTELDHEHDDRHVHPVRPRLRPVGRA